MTVTSALAFDGVAARVMLGCGDAMVFTSLLRLIALWFHVKQAPMITQLTGMIGQLGADEVAAAAVWLASPAAGFVTGATLDLNGGRLMR